MVIMVMMMFGLSCAPAAVPRLSRSGPQAQSSPPPSPPLRSPSLASPPRALVLGTSICLGSCPGLPPHLHLGRRLCSRRSPGQSRWAQRFGCRPSRHWRCRHLRLGRPRRRRYGLRHPLRRRCRHLALRRRPRRHLPGSFGRRLARRHRGRRRGRT